MRGAGLSFLENTQPWNPCEYHRDTTVTDLEVKLRTILMIHAFSHEKLTTTVNPLSQIYIEQKYPIQPTHLYYLPGKVRQIQDFNKQKRLLSAVQYCSKAVVGLKSWSALYQH